MNIPTGIVAVGSDEFAQWARPLIGQANGFDHDADLAFEEVSGETLAKLRPRATFIEFDSTSPGAAINAGIVAQKGYRWTSVVLVFNPLNTEVVSISASIRARRWSLVGRDLFTQISIDRVLSGALTEQGLIDFEIASRLSEMSEPAETTDDVESDDEESAVA